MNGDMPVKPEPNGRSAHRTRTPSESPADDQDPSPPSEDEDAHHDKRLKTEKGKGRARVQPTQDDDESEGEQPQGDEDEDEREKDPEPEEDEKDFSQEKQQLVRDDSGYVTGSIVRIACHSFLTYDEVEFRPGAALNMIIGPNGTGKSTIACAIAIGLGFPTKVLGRSNKLSAFCKNDSNEETWIEIELKGKPGKKNLVVRRYLHRDSERSDFTLNGEKAKVDEVADHMEELQVQIGNLCTFLPQDRVASFAMMSPSQLLMETEKAAGHRQLSTWHELLIAEHKQCKAHQGDVDRISEKLNRVKVKQAETEREVRAFEQREALEQQLAVVEILYKFALYNEVFHRHSIAKQARTVLTNEVAQLEAKNKPFKESKARLKDIVKASEKQQRALDDKVKKATKDAGSKQYALEKLTDEREKLSSAIQDLRKDEEARREQMRKYAKEIEKLQPLVENEPPVLDMADINRQIHAKTNERNEVVALMQANHDKIGNFQEDAQRYKAQVILAEKALRQSQEVSRQREDAFAKWEPEAWRAVEWLRENKHRMKGQVFEPARLNVFPKQQLNGKKLNLAESGVMDLIEAPISLSAFSNFLFEFRADYDLMFDELVDKPTANKTRPTRFNGSEIDINRTLASLPRPCSNEQLDAFGFDALSVDLIDGPEPVLVWLCEQHGIGRVPVQIWKRDLDTRAIEQSRAFQRYYTRDGSVSVTFSKYGQKFAQIEQRSLPPAKILRPGVDENRVKAINDRIQSINGERAKLKEEVVKLSSVQADLDAQKKQIEAERNELKAEADGMQKQRQIWLRATTKYNATKVTLDKLRNAPSAESKRKGYNARLGQIMEKRVKLVLEYKDFVDRATEKQEQSVKIHFQALQADSDHRAMETMVKEKDEELEEKQAELRQAQVDAKALATEGKVLLAAANTAKDDASDEINMAVMARREKATEDNEDLDVELCEKEMGEIQSNLNCMASVSPQVMEHYNKRKEEIIASEAKLNAAQETLDESLTTIAETRTRWLPRLERLVEDVSAKFTAAFDTLGLLGEVRLAQHEDYEKWGIEIMVSFRDQKDDSGDVTLHVLSGHRQSGGERALTTVTYLLALAELARAPFALVDEINQGMDQRAERAMHKMLVQTSCKDTVGQYFLLTPKLLPDLMYHPKMKVLVINVSPWLPKGLSLKEIVAAKQQGRGYDEKKAKALVKGRA